VRAIDVEKKGGGKRTLRLSSPGTVLGQDQFYSAIEHNYPKIVQEYVSTARYLIHPCDGSVGSQNRI
jgi:hypothetical protein